MDKIVWIKKGVSSYISINIDEIKAFSNINSYLYINNKKFIKDSELILFNALEKLFEGGRGSMMTFDNNISKYNKLISERQNDNN